MRKPWLEHYQDIATICLPLYGRDINYFAHAYIQPNGSYFVLANDPSATEHYISEKGLPPSGLSNFNQLKSGAVFLGDKDDNALGFTAGTLKTLQERFNIVNPLLCVQKHDTFAELYLFGLNLDNAYQAYSKQPDFFQQFLFYYKDKAKDIIDDAKILMPTAPVPLEQSQVSQCIDNLNSGFEINTYWITTQNGDVRFTKNEYAIFAEIGRGLEAKEIAILLNKSESTVKNVITEIKVKTGLSRKADLRKLYLQNHVIRT